MQPVISIIMPCFNGSKFIGQAVESILSQSFTDFELIIVNDASTDNSMEIIREFQDPRIRIVENNAWLGIAKTRNRGLDEARGRYIAPFDADDVALPLKLEKQARFLERNSEFGMIGSWVKRIDGQSGRLSGKWKLTAKPESIPPILLFRNYFCHSSVMMRREAIPSEGYDPGFAVGEDYNMWIKITRRWKAWNLPEYLVLYREHAGSAMTGNPGILQESERKIFSESFQCFDIQPDKRQLDILQEFKNPGSSILRDNISELESLLKTILEINSVRSLYPQRELIKTILNRYTRFLIHSKGDFSQKIRINFLTSLMFHYMKTTG